MVVLFYKTSKDDSVIFKNTNNEPLMGNGLSSKYLNKE